MKAVILISLLVVAVSASVKEIGIKFHSFKKTHSKTYINQVEEARRLAIFQDNLRSIEQHNVLYEQGLVTYKQGINKFSDMTQEEFRAFLTLRAKPSFNATKYTKYVKTGHSVPSSVDWRREGLVSEVKDQGVCGSCWAFSVTGSTEGAYYRKSGKFASLSEQQLVDCSTDINSGCEGGYLDETFKYVAEYGLQSASSYKYTGIDDSCKYDASKVVAKVSNYVSISEDEDALLEAVGTVGPVSVAMDASYLSSYSSGIYADSYCSEDSLNHGVLVVGYGTENCVDYWIVKNSWSAEWGEQGYFRIRRGINQCGIAADNVYPIIN